MNVDDDERRYVWWPAEITADPNASTVVLEVDATTYPMTWETTAVQTGAVWTRLARTVKTFTGTSVTPGVNDVALGAGRHIGQPIVTLADGQTITGPLSPIDVT